MSSSSSSLLLSDILPRSRSTTFFTEALLSSSPVLSALVADPSALLVVLAPTNAAVDALPAKIWQLYPAQSTTTTTSTPTAINPMDNPAAFQGPEGQARARRNEEVFCQRHVVVVRDRSVGWAEGERATTADEAWGQQVWWEQRGNKRVVSLVCALVCTFWTDRVDHARRGRGRDGAAGREQWRTGECGL